MTIEKFLGCLSRVRRSGHGWEAVCPAHKDRDPSLSIDDGRDKILIDCKAGCSAEAVVAALGLQMKDLFYDNAEHSTAGTTYRYEDEGRRHLYDVVRFEPKDFRQRSAGGAWKMDGVRRVLYRLPELQGQSVAYIVEGEKDADRLRSIDLAGTTNVGGAGKWRDEYVKQLKAASVERVVILPDNDDPGRHHAAAVAASCYAAGLAVKIVELPDLPLKGQDVSDWLDGGHTRDELVALVKATAPYTPTISAPPAASALPAPVSAAALVVQAGGSFLLAQIVGDIGKRKEPALFDSFGGRPTERMLCHEHTSNRILLAERHRKLAKLFPKLKIPTADSEKKDRPAALEVYAACVDKMRARARADNEKFPHVHRENVHYGFRRNLWGLKPYGIAVTLVSLVVVSADMVGQLMAHEQIHLAVPAIAGFDLLLLVAWIFVVTRNWVKRAAVLYAERLLEALDVLA